MINVDEKQCLIEFVACLGFQLVIKFKIVKIEINVSNVRYQYVSVRTISKPWLVVKYIRTN